MYTIKIAMLIISMLIDVIFQKKLVKNDNTKIKRKKPRKTDKERYYLIKEQFLQRNTFHRLPPGLISITNIYIKINGKSK